MDASDPPTTPPAPPATEPAPSAPAPEVPQPPVPPPPVHPAAFVPAAAPTPWWHRRWVPIVGAIAAALVLLGVGWTAGYTMAGGDGGHRHSQYNNGPFGNRRGFDGQRGFQGPQVGPKQNRPFGPHGPQQSQPTPQPTPSKSG